MTELGTTLVENQQHIGEWLQGHRGPIDIAVAFWGHGAIEELGIDRMKRRTRVLLNLPSGGTNPEVVKALNKLSHVEIRNLPDLHAKAYITKDAVVVGSANASANGLGSEGGSATQWRELGMKTSDAGVVQATKAWFTRQWKAARPISKSDLTKATELWNQRQRLRPKVQADTKEILAAAELNPSEFRNRGIYVVVTTKPWNSKGDDDAKEYKSLTGHQALGWQSWPDIPKDATLICFVNYKDEGFRWDDPKVCYSPKKPNRHRSLYLVSKSTLDDGFELDSIAKWRRALEDIRLKISDTAWRKEQGLCMDLGDFAQALKTHGK